MCVQLIIICFSTTSMQDLLEMKIMAFSWNSLEGESCMAREASVTLSWLQCLMPCSSTFFSALSVGLPARRQAVLINSKGWVASIANTM